MIGTAVVHHAEALALHPGGLVHEALAVGVHEQEGPVEHGRSLGMHHGRPGAFLEGAAGPRRHVVAIAHVALVGAQAGEHAVGHRRERIDVLVVVADVARGQNDALGSVVLHVLAGLVLADGAGHLPGLVLYQLHSGHLVDELGAGLQGLGLEHVLDEVGHGVLFEDGAAGHEVVAGDLRVHRGVGAHGDHAVGAIGLGHVEEPVHAALGLAEPLAHERLAAAVAAGGDPALHLQGFVELQAQVVQGARGDSAGAAHAMAIEHGVLLHEDGLGAVLGRGQRAAAAGVAAADDEHLGVDGLGDLVGRDGLGLHFPGVLGGLAGLGQAGLGLGGLGLRRASGQAERGHAGSTEGSALEQVATRNSSHVFPP